MALTPEDLLIIDNLITTSLQRVVAGALTRSYVDRTYERKGVAAGNPLSSDLNAAGHSITDLLNLVLTSGANSVIASEAPPSGEGKHLSIRGGQASAGNDDAGGNLKLDGGVPDGGGASGNVEIGLLSTKAIKAGGATTEIGFYGATPIAQPSSTGQVIGIGGGGGAAVDVDSTFTGGQGTKAYTVGDVVRHLKLVGILKQS